MRADGILDSTPSSHNLKVPVGPIAGAHIDLLVDKQDKLF
jgi:hypothetical protein